MGCQREKEGHCGEGNDGNGKELEQHSSHGKRASRCGRIALLQYYMPPRVMDRASEGIYIKMNN